MFRKEETMNREDKIFCFKGTHGSICIKEDDKVARKLLMILEGECMGVPNNIAAEKYGYCRQHYYTIVKSFKENGIEGLKEKPVGPKRKHIRTNEVINEIIRHRFLDPEASAAVIAQKIRQSGIKVSQRSVERTITERGLQKKTSFIKSGREAERG
jgi:transposase